MLKPGQKKKDNKPKKKGVPNAKVSAETAAKTEDGLNQQQEAFCQLYVNSERELFGNGAQCYLEVYGAEYFLKTKRPMDYKVAVVNASRLLTNAKVIARINQLLEDGGFNDENVDRQHLFLINQHADLKTKMAAIREFNELKGRIKKRLELTGLNGTPLFNPEHKTKADDALAELIG